MSEVLVLDRVYKTFGKRTVVNDVSFSVREGEVFGFLGPNGAGKTTTIKMILGLLSIDSGTITVDGHNVERDFEAAMKNLSGIVENPDMYPYLTGYDNLMIQARACGVGAKQVDEAVRMVGMQMRIKEKFKTYSLGMKQRLGIAQALLHQPKIMILDEPTNGLDPAGIQEMRNLLRHLAHNAGVSVLVSSHILQEMQLMCDTVGIISNGTLLQVADVEELISRSKSNTYRYILRPLDRAAELLRTYLPDRVLEITGDHVDLRITEEEIATVNRRLMENDVVILGLTPVGQSLEQSFMELTGGGNIIG